MIRSQSSARAASVVQEGGESLATLMPRLTEAEVERVTKLTPGGLMRFPMLLRRKHCNDDDELLSSYLKPDDSREEMRLHEKRKM